jgi:hypothetical protein
MMELQSVKDAFGFFGAVPVNRQWSWSARSPDGSTVVLTWWKDQEARRDGKLVYDTRNDPNLAEWPTGAATVIELGILHMPATIAADCSE